MPEPELLHGLNGQDITAIRQTRDAEMKARAIERRDNFIKEREERKHPQGPEKESTKGNLSVSINAPHKVQARGNAIAITIQNQPGTPGSGNGETLVLLEDDVYFNDADDKFYWINIWTDGRFEEI